MRFLSTARKAFVWLFALAFVGTAGFAAWGIHVSPDDVLAKNRYTHSVTPLDWASSLITYTHDDGNVSNGARLDQPGALATVLYFGGNGYTLDRFGTRTRPAFQNLPVNVVIYDRRGYGRTAGKPDIVRWERDAIELYRHTVTTEHVPVIVHGHSLGTFIASRLVADVNPPWVVLEAPGTNVSDFIRTHFGYGLGGLVRVVLTPELADIDSPGWLQHGTGSVAVLKAPIDAVLPSWMADAVAAAVPGGRGRLITCPGADHNTMGATGCYPLAYEPWLTMLRTIHGASARRAGSNAPTLPVVAVRAHALTAR